MPSNDPQLSVDFASLADIRPAWEARPVVAAAVDVRGSLYRVKAGDTLRAIGETTGAGSEAIARANALSAPFIISPGQMLKIPGGRYHRVSEGETGIAIARAYGLPWNRIVESNALAEPFILRVGQRLVLPPDAAPATAATSLEARAAAFQIGIDDLVTGSEPARTVDLATPVRTATATSIGFVWPTQGKLTARFGPQGNGRVNQGIDIDTAAGTGIRAATAGTVAFVGTGVPGFGGLILVRHDGNWISAYGRISKASVAKGDTVVAGQLVGKSGGDPLHFELRRARVPVDPLKYLPAR